MLKPKVFFSDSQSISNMAKNQQEVCLCSVLAALTIQFCSQVSKCRIKKKRIKNKF